MDKYTSGDIYGSSRNPCLCVDWSIILGASENLRRMVHPIALTGSAVIRLIPPGVKRRGPTTKVALSMIIFFILTGIVGSVQLLDANNLCLAEKIGTT